MANCEQVRLAESRDRLAHWKRWGPYLSDRAWGTVREDYSTGGDAWDYFPHDHARSRAYRWNEDGLMGICDRHQRICFALALWNGRDPILKERLFGLSGPEGNHAEDVKEQYYYLDSTPTHSYMKALYKYPQRAFPYDLLVDENRRRDRKEREFELIDTGIFDDNRYFDIEVEYAKATCEDILIRIIAHNRGPETAELHILPAIWFRNVWSWDGSRVKPRLWKRAGESVVDLEEVKYGCRALHMDGSPTILFTENETNAQLLFGTENESPYVKDAINNRIVRGDLSAVNPRQQGTKAAGWYKLTVPAHGSVTVRTRFTDNMRLENAFGPEFDRIFAQRLAESNEFYAEVSALQCAACSVDARNIMRQAFAGLMWSKQFYHYVVRDWLRGDPACPSPSKERLSGRNHEWTHLYNADIISMPDKWEYPWYAAWDLAFHVVPIALIDSDFAKEQLMLMVREWYMHPNGQLPAYEWCFADVNPPVHAWAAWRVYKIEKKRRGVGDREFLQRIFHKLLLNFTWWVNRKDSDGRNIFQGGFLGLDNIGVFDRSKPLPTGGHIEQADGTGWMAMYSLNLLAIALELARDDPAYEDVASKFWEHFLFIANAMNHLGGDGRQLWNSEDGFFYDLLHFPDGKHMPLRIRSMVGLIPLFAVETLEPEMLERLPGFNRRLQWFIRNRNDLTAGVASMTLAGSGERRLLSIVDAAKLRSTLRYLLDEEEFLSPYGVRALSRFHKHHPYRFNVDGREYRVDYDPGESSIDLFGGNSNWRGPVWFPVNFLLVESLQRFHHYYGDGFKVECPTGSGCYMTLWEVAAEISRRLIRIFLSDRDKRRPVHGSHAVYQRDPAWKDLILFYEHFHGDDGSGLGASHQTGWTALIAKLLQQTGD